MEPAHSEPIALKQKYLVEEVVEQGYDPDNYVQFLTSLKEGGDDINNWTLAELMETVRIYKERKSVENRRQEDLEQQQRSGQVNQPKVIPGELPEVPPDAISEQPKASEEPIEVKQLGAEQRQPKKIVYERYGVDDREMTKKIQCVQFRKFMDKAAGPLEVAISKPEFKTTGGFLGFGSTTHLWFTVKTNILESEVKRTDGDFEWLRNTIVRMNPGYIVPHLKPAKPIAETERREQATRMNMIRMFLEELSKQPILFNTKLVVSFLTWSDYERFNQYRKEVDDTNFVRVLSKLPSMDGTQQLVISEENRRLLNGLDRYTISTGEIYQGLKADVKEMMKNLEDLTITVYKIANSFAEMQEKYSALVEVAPSLENQEFFDVLICLNNVMAQWGKTYDEQKRAIDVHLGSFFNFQRAEDGSVRELMQRRSEAEQEYLRFRSNLLKKKQKLYPDPSKWQAPQNIMSRISNVDKLGREEAYGYMLPRESEQQSKLKEWVAYLNKRCQQAFQEQLPIVKSNYIRAFKKLGCDLIANTKPEVEALSRLSTGLL